MLFASESPRTTSVTRARVVGEEHRRLPGRVAGADQVDVAPLGRARLAARRAVVHALADAAGRSPSMARRRQVTPVARMMVARAHRVAAVEDAPRASPDRCATTAARHQDLRAQPARLLQRAAGELVARDAAGKAEVVLDARRGPRLAARRLALDDQRAQPLRRAVDRGGQAGRPAADDDRVVLVPRAARLQAEALGDVARLRPRISVVPSAQCSAGSRRRPRRAPGQRAASRARPASASRT